VRLTYTYGSGKEPEVKHRRTGSGKTAIEWSEVVWNPVTGCDRVSPGCAHCYAAKMAVRLKAMGQARYQRDGGPASGPGFGVTLHPDLLDLPLRWKKPRMIFVNSMSDLFHDEVPDGFIDYVFATMALAGQHTFQVLTKRPERMQEYVGNRTAENERGASFWRLVEGQGYRPAWPLRNVWLGVSAENQRWADERIPLLLDTPAAVPFVSCEPLLGPVNLGTLVYHFPGPGHTAIDWVIVGGESGAMSTRGGPERALVERCHDRRPPTYHLHVDGHDIGHRVCTGWRPKAEALEWVRSLRDQCVAAGVPFFFKQWGGPTPKAAGALLDGREWREMPDASG